MQLSDEEFVTQFENRTLPEEQFSHRGHMRLAWLYLNQFDIDTAVAKLAVGIQAYASSLGGAEKFHYTLTEAIARIMHQRMSTTTADSFEGYLEANTDLIEDLLGILTQHYSQELLYSPEAKQRFVAPDLKDFS